MTGRVSNLAEELAAALRNTPHLPRAVCRDRGTLFDPSDPSESPAVAHERHELASQLCAGCPERTPCGQWADSLPRGAVRGIVAGQLRGGPPRTDP